MLVIANGAFKSGSTWQRNLIKGLIDFEPIPEIFQSEMYTTFINSNCLSEIIESPEIKKHNYLAKGHFYKKAQIKLLTKNIEDVKIFMIERDIRDAIVSHYNHFINVRRFKPSFKTYYWLIGRYKAIQLIKYNKNWAPFQHNVFHSTFESLKKDTLGELKRFADFLGVSIDERQIKEIIDANSIQKIRENSDRKWFFRKGEVGDYRNYLTPSIEKDMERIINKTTRVDEIGYYLIFELRHALS